MKEIQVFKNELFGEIRTLTGERGEPLFVGKDVAKALGYRNPSNALQVHVDDEDKTSYLIQVPGSNYKANTLMINESGLYALVLSSKLPTASAQRNRPRCALERFFCRSNIKRQFLKSPLSAVNTGEAAKVTSYKLH